MLIRILNGSIIAVVALRKGEKFPPSVKQFLAPFSFPNATVSRPTRLDRYAF